MASFKILTPPAVEPLSVSRLKTQLRMEQDYTDEDDYLGELCCAARERAEALTNRCFVTQTIRQYRDDFSRHHREGIGVGSGTGWEWMHRAHRKWELMRSPVQSITAIGYLDVNGAEQVVDPSLYNSDLVLEPGAIYRAPGSCWPLTQCGVPNSEWVDYVAGYSDDDSKVPATLKNAMALMAAHWFGNREPIQGVPMAEIPMAATSLLNLNKMYYQA